MKVGVDNPRESVIWFSNNALLAAVVLFGLFAIRVCLLSVRRFDPDEFEHLHAAWCVSKGEIPYKDFFEHHTPLFYWMLAPLIRLLTADDNPRSLLTFLFVARSLSVSMAAICLYQVFWIGRHLSGSLAGLFSALFLSGIPFFLDKTLEVRPDVPALVLWLGCLQLLFSGLSADADNTCRRRFFLAGLILGSALMFTQKMLFTLPGLVFGLLLWVVLAPPSGQIQFRSLATVSFAAGLVILPLLTWLFFIAHTAGWQFISLNFVLNAQWKVRRFPKDIFFILVGQIWPLLLLCIAGISDRWGHLAFEWRAYWQRFILLTTLMGLLVGAFIIPIAEQQYFLMLLPLIAIFAGEALARLRISFLFSKRDLTIGIIICLTSIYPVHYALNRFQTTNDQQLRSIEYVLKTSGPHDLVVDGWRGVGLYRHHAFYYYFLHSQIRAIIPRLDLNHFIDDLEAGRLKPQLIIMDKHLELLSPRFSKFVLDNYTLGADRDIYVRKAD